MVIMNMLWSYNTRNEGYANGAFTEEYNAYLSGQNAALQRKYTVL